MTTKFAQEKGQGDKAMFWIVEFIYIIAKRV